MKFNIKTERLTLRDLLPADVEAMFKLDSDPLVHQYLGNNPINKIEQAHAVIEGIRKQYIHNGIGRWATIENASGKFIGWSGLKFITEAENNRVGFYDVGYRFMPEYWGKGYATESGKAALKYGFEVLDLEEIIGTCHEDNKASRRSLEKCGLHFIEKFLYKSELPCDWMKITKEEWLTLQKENK